MTCKDCFKTCPYFPDMTCNNFEVDQETGLKKRKPQKVFTCGYDGNKIDWNKKCPLEES